LKSKYLPVDIAVANDEGCVKGDPFTEDLTVRQMIDAILETGTPFDYKDVDFTKLLDKYEQFEADLADDADDQDVQDDGKGGLMTLSPSQDLRVGEVDIPVRDVRYIDQRDERFEDAPGKVH
jgi:hypothetical protein